MTIVTDSLKKSTININNISKSLSETKRSVSTVNDSVSNISKIISSNTRIKKELFANSEIISSRRREASKRQELEDQIESAKVSTKPSLGLAFAGRSDKGPFGRLLGFLGFTFSGWIAENLPTWIFMGKEFISRIQMFGKSMYNMVGNMELILQSFGSVLKNSFSAIINLDLNEFSDGSVAKSFNELNLAVQGLGDDLTETFKLFTTPLNKSLETGEEAPALDEDRPDTMFPPTSQGEMRTVTGIHKEALDIIAKYESVSSDRTGDGYNAMNQGGTGMSGIYGYGSSTSLLSKKLTDMTVGEVMERQRKNNQYSGPNKVGIFAAGRYQIIPGTLKGIVDNGIIKVSDRFDQQTQDKAGLYLIKTRGIQPWGWDAASKARFTGREQSIIQQARKTPATFSQQTVSTPSIQPQIRQVPVGNINPKVGDRLGAGRNHGGVDLLVPSGTPLRAISDGVIVDSDYESGWGNFLVMKDNLGIYHLYGHMQSGYKRGGPVKKGEVIGKVGMTGRATGPHLHWEAGTGWDKYQLSGRFDALTKYSKFAPFNTQASKETPAQITTPPSRVTQPDAMTPERKGPQLLIIEDIQPQMPQVSYSSPQQSQTPTISESKLLNNFIKNKLLLDLAYL